MSGGHRLESVSSSALLLEFGTSLGFVERRFERCWSRCPLIIGAERGGWRRTCAEVMLGKVVRRPASIAAHQVEKNREKIDAWMKAMRSASVEEQMTEFAVCKMSVRLVLGCGRGKSRC